MRINAEITGSPYPAPATAHGILRALDSLQEDNRMVVWLHFCMDFEISDIADILAIPEQSVSQLLTQSVRRLKKRLVKPISDSDLALELALACAPHEDAPASLVDDIFAMADPEEEVGKMIRGKMIEEDRARRTRPPRVDSSRIDATKPPFASIRAIRGPSFRTPSPNNKLGDTFDLNYN